MTDPATPIPLVLVATAVAVAGPVLGPYALIVFAACAGTGLALSATPTGTRWAGAKFMAMGTLVALLLTGPVVWLVEKYTAVPANIALIPVAFALGAARSQLYPFITKLLDAVAAGASAFSTAAANWKGGGQ